jgi:hypothetical protein
MADTGYKYFIYSATQLKERTNIEKQVGRTFVPGNVSVGPKLKKYTELSSTGKSRYSDAVIVAKGDVSKMSYTPIKSLR